jgi:hypothetical protein
MPAKQVVASRKGKQKKLVMGGCLMYPISVIICLAPHFAYQLNDLAR